MSIYRGFNTQGNTKRFKLTDFELVKRDLLNHFYLRRGEKLMNPTFGSLIWDALFSPLDDELRKTISDDVKRIVAYELRVQLDTIIITEFNHGLQIELELTYILTNELENLIMRFDRDSQTLTVVT